MKRFIITITLLAALVGSAFAEKDNLIKYGTFTNKNAGEYTVYMDIDAREPFDVKNEKLWTIISLEANDDFRCVKVHLYKVPEDCNWWCINMCKNYNVYCTIEDYNDYILIDRVCGDGTIVEYTCYKNKEEE